MVSIIKTIFQLFNQGNLVFFAILVAGWIFMYLLAMVLNTLQQVIETKRRSMLWLYEGLEKPLLMLLLNTAYILGSSYLTIPFISSVQIDQSLDILLMINVAWFSITLGTSVLVTIFKALPRRLVRYFATALVIIWVIVIIALHLPYYPALIMGALFGGLFMFLAARTSDMAPRQRIASQEVIPKRLVISHIYISTSETDESVKRAIHGIQEAIAECEGTDKTPHATLSGFTHGAFDVLVRYYIVETERIEEIKQNVNLSIIRKLKDINIKLSER